MSIRLINNPNGAFGVTDGDQKYFRIVASFVADTADIDAGDLVSFEWTETGEVLKVDQTAAAGDGALVAGVALNSPDDEGICEVVVYGYAEVNIGTGTATAGHVAKVDGTTAGVAASADGAATDVVGDVIGIFLGDEIGSTNRAPLWVCKL